MRTLFKIYFSILTIAIPILGIYGIWNDFGMIWKWLLTDLLLMAFGIFSFLVLTLFDYQKLKP